MPNINLDKSDSNTILYTRAPGKKSVSPLLLKGKEAPLDLSQIVNL